MLMQEGIRACGYPRSGSGTKRATGATVDHSNISEGYIIVQCSSTSGKRHKVNIASNGRSQNFNLPNDGMSRVYPLCFGSGSYIIRIYRQIEGTRYKSALTFSTDVKLRDELLPFLYPNVYSDYGPQSLCVMKATGLCAGLTGDVDKINTIYNWIVENVEYDKELAAQVKTDSWWLPVPDEVISTGKSICFGYASLFAAMCRSQGIPTKIEVGRIGSAGCHAWNTIYSRQDGNVAGLPVTANAWSRIDVTLMDSSRGEGLAFVREDRNYTVEYCG